MAKLRDETVLILGGLGLGAYLLYSQRKAISNAFEGAAAVPQGIGEAVTGLGGGVSQGAAGLGYGIEQFGKGSGTIFKEIGETAEAAYNVPQAIFKGAAGTAQNLGTGAENLSGIFADTTGQLRRSFQTGAAQKALLTVSMSTAGRIREAYQKSEIVDKIKEELTGEATAKRAASTVRSVRSSYTKAASNYVSSVSKAAQLTAQSVSRAVSSVRSTYQKTAPVDKIKDTAQSFISRAVSSVRSTFQSIGSRLSSLWR